MCKCTPEIRTPYCGKGDCVFPHEKPDGVRSNEMSDKMPECECGAKMLDGGHVGYYCSLGNKCPTWNTRATPCADIKDDGLTIAYLKGVYDERDRQEKMSAGDELRGCTNSAKVDADTSERIDRGNASKVSGPTTSLAGDVGEALRELPTKEDLKNHVGHESEDYLYHYGDIIRAALTAQSVNGQMLEALKKAEKILNDCPEPVFDRDIEFDSDNAKIYRAIEDAALQVYLAIAAAEKAQGEG